MFSEGESAEARIQEIGRTLPSFAELESAYGFHVFKEVETTVQASFGNLSMFRRTLKGATAAEYGPSLVYQIR